MSPIQQIFLGLGAVIKKLYQEDLFSIYLWKGDSSTNRTITNGLDLSTEGGMVWFKQRSGSEKHQIYDTARGVTKALQSSANAAEITLANGLKSFTTTGFTMGSDNTNNDNGAEYVAWSLRKAKGFFDIVEWTRSGSNGSARTLNHNLECIPGFIMLKQTTGTENWICYHRDFSDNQFIKLNSTHAIGTDANASVNSVSSTQFVVGADNNKIGSYVAYLFAGGESTAATARSVEFDHNGDYLSCTHGSAGSSDFSVGTGDFTIECWIKISDPDQYHGVFQVKDGTLSTSGLGTQLAVVWRGNNHTWQVYGSDATTESAVRDLKEHQWQHVALVRASSKTTLYINGMQEISQNDTVNYDHHGLTIGAVYSSTIELLGNVSNFRFVKGTAVYTSAFRPPTEPLTNITNTKLLCCQNSTTTGSTVIPSGSSITANGDPTASTDSPFDDPAGFAFGDSGDQNLIKCGSYVGNGNNNGPEVYLGWEPSLLMIRTMGASATGNWVMIDNMRGADTEKQELMSANLDNGDNYYDVAKFTNTGFKLIRDDFSGTNGNGKTILYIAIRRPDGYVGKPPELGTGVFTTMAGQSSGVPGFRPTDFPVDFVLHREPASTQNWYTSSRLTGIKYLFTDSNAAEGDNSYAKFDYQDGYNSYDGDNSAWQAWMWKRHAGFTVCTWEGDGVIGRQIPHDMNKIPEMIWLKKRTGTARNWPVYHKGLDGGSSPEEKVVWLNLTNTQSDAVEPWNNTAPTSTHFTIHGTVNTPNVNKDGEDYIAMLFASVDGISKVGSYTGTGNAMTVTVGFQPRMLIWKNVTEGDNWRILDTTRGWGSGNDKPMRLSSNLAQYTEDVGAPTATGFTWVADTDTAFNKAGCDFIYYAHA